IDKVIVRLLREGGDIYVIDDDALRKADPDLIVAQGLCEVCSPHVKEVDKAVQILGRKPEVVVLDPHDLDDILTGIGQVAKITGREKRGQEVVQELGKRIGHVRSVAVNAKQKPRVLCIEWLDPIFTSGHWVPGLVETAGAINGVSKTGEPSRRMEWGEALQFDPDIVVLMPCGFDIERTMRELWRIERREEWKNLNAVKKKMVYLTDAGSYFSRPGPRTVTGLEILAKIIHPDLFPDLVVPDDSFRKLY
ncbi:MAG: ABC transporter substrate-binding protein, partial [Nitrososphaerales archaeon]